MASANLEPAAQDAIQWTTALRPLGKKPSWSVEALKAHIKAGDFRKYGALPNNFELTIPDSRQAAKAVRAFKDEYLLDYINIEDADSEQDVDERELNKALVLEVKKFILGVKRIV